MLEVERAGHCGHHVRVTARHLDGLTRPRGRVPGPRRGSWPRPASDPVPAGQAPKCASPVRALALDLGVRRVQVRGRRPTDRRTRFDTVKPCGARLGVRLGALRARWRGPSPKRHVRRSGAPLPSQGQRGYGPPPAPPRTRGVVAVGQVSSGISTGRRFSSGTLAGVSRYALPTDPPENGHGLLRRLGSAPSDQRLP